MTKDLPPGLAGGYKTVFLTGFNRFKLAFRNSCGRNRQKLKGPKLSWFFQTATALNVKAVSGYYWNVSAFWLTGMVFCLVIT